MNEEKENKTLLEGEGFFFCNENGAIDDFLVVKSTETGV
jgi:hypothetical protein